MPYKRKCQERRRKENNAKSRRYPLKNVLRKKIFSVPPAEKTPPARNGRINSHSRIINPLNKNKISYLPAFSLAKSLVFFVFTNVITDASNRSKVTFFILTGINMTFI